MKREIEPVSPLCTTLTHIIIHSELIICYYEEAQVKLCLSSFFFSCVILAGGAHCICVYIYIEFGLVLSLALILPLFFHSLEHVAHIYMQIMLVVADIFFIISFFLAVCSLWMDGQQWCWLFGRLAECADTHAKWFIGHWWSGHLPVVYSSYRLIRLVKCKDARGRYFALKQVWNKNAICIRSQIMPRCQNSFWAPKMYVYAYTHRVWWKPSRPEITTDTTTARIEQKTKKKTEHQILWIQIDYR